MTEINYMRQLAWFNPQNADLPMIHVIGCGGIGSFLVPMLVKMGWCRVAVYDFDRVEEHNLPNQNFKLADVGEYKVDAIQLRIYEDTGAFIEVVPRKFDVNSIVDPERPAMYVLAVDSIDMRKELYQQVRGLSNCIAILDGRLGGLLYECMGIDTRKLEQLIEYECTLFDGGKSVQAPCTAKSIIYMGSAIAADLCSMIRKWYTGGQTFECMCEVGRDLR